MRRCCSATACRRAAGTIGLGAATAPARRRTCNPARWSGGVVTGGIRHCTNRRYLAGSCALHWVQLERGRSPKPNRWFGAGPKPPALRRACGRRRRRGCHRRPCCRRTSSRPSPALGRRGTGHRESRTARGPAGGVDRAPGLGTRPIGPKARGRARPLRPLQAGSARASVEDPLHRGQTRLSQTGPREPHNNSGPREPHNNSPPREPHNNSPPQWSARACGGAGRTPRRPCSRGCRPPPSCATESRLQAALLRPPLRLRTSGGGSELLPFFRSEISDLIELTVRNRCILSRRCRPSQTPRLTRSSCPKGHLARKKRLGLSSTQRNKITLKVAAFYRRSRSHFRISN